MVGFWREEEEVARASRVLCTRRLCREQKHGLASKLEERYVSFGLGGGNVASCMALVNFGGTGGHAAAAAVLRC